MFPLRRKSILWLALASTFAFAVETHVVRPKDTLSQILRSRFPEARLYGAGGMIRRIQAMNPGLRNPHRIYPGQTLFLESPGPSAAQHEHEAARSPSPVTVPSREIGNAPGDDAWRLSALYGARFISLAQSGSGGSVDFGVVFLDSALVRSEFQLDDWSVWASVDTYTFRFEASDSADQARLTTLTMGGGYREWLFGVEVSQLPVFRVKNGDVSMARAAISSVVVGHRKHFVLPTTKPTSLDVRAQISTVFGASASDGEIVVNSARGYGFSLDGQLSRRLSKGQQHALSLTWQSGVGLRQLHQKVEWDSETANVKTQVFDVSTRLGLELEF